jgi:predicted RNA-binding Zn-ribbon protein involved in translation (DUF1610 family)
MSRKTPINLSDSLPQVKPQGGQPKLAKEMRGKPLTHEYVASEIAKAGYTLESQYKNNKTPLKVRCDQDHRYYPTWNSFQQGKRCSGCRKKSHEYVASEIAKDGYTLKSQYENSETHLDIECDQGHRYPATWKNFQQGYRCPECRKLTQEYVASEIAKDGHTLRSQYKNSQTRLDIECDKGHRYYPTWSNFQQGHRCPGCSVTGYQPTKPGRLYYIRFDFPDGLSLYKIGITNRTIKQRFYGESTPYIVLRDLYYEDGAEALEEEDRIKKRHAKDQYTGPSLLVSGITECFTRDVLKLDTPACSAA